MYIPISYIYNYSSHNYQFSNSISNIIIYTKIKAHPQTNSSQQHTQFQTCTTLDLENQATSTYISHTLKNLMKLKLTFYKSEIITFL